MKDFLLVEKLIYSDLCFFYCKIKKYKYHYISKKSCCESIRKKKSAKICILKKNLYTYISNGGDDPHSWHRVATK